MGRILLAGLLLFASAFCARAEEKITSFHSRIEVKADASVRVTDDIEVIAEGNIIRRGILYSLPLDREGRRVSYDIVSVERDGKPEPWHVDEGEGNFDFYTGSANVFLPSGPYSYKIVYDAPLQVSLFDDFDEITWNVTGKWPFRVGKVVAEVVLPEGAIALQSYGYTGQEGQQGKDYVVESTPSGTVFSTTRVLEPDEQLTVSTSFPKGFVTLPPGATVMQVMLDWHLFGLLPLLLVLGYFLLVWHKFGRDPDVGPVIPEYDAPEGMSAAAIAHFMSMGRDMEKIRATGVISLCVKGWLGIEGVEESPTFALKGGRPGAPPLDADETIFLEALRAKSRKGAGLAGIFAPSRLPTPPSGGQPSSRFGYKISWDGLPTPPSGGQTSLTGEDVYEASEKLLWRLRSRFAIRFIEGNFLFWAAGMGMAAFLSSASLWLLSGYNEADLPLAVPFFVVCTFLVLLRVPFSGVRLLYGFALILPFAGLAASAHLERQVPVLESVLLASVALVPGVFSWLMERPSETYLKLRNRMLGLKRYLVMAEQERLEFAHPLAKTPEVFERFLPYALALGVENQWAEAFAEILEGYRPAWDSGSGITRGNYVRRIDHVSNSLRPRYVAPPSGGYSGGHSGSTHHYHSSSSGGSHSSSSGGGSSGGGGGGGRRGGW